MFTLWRYNGIVLAELSLKYTIQKHEIGMKFEIDGKFQSDQNMNSYLSYLERAI